MKKNIYLTFLFFSLLWPAVSFAQADTAWVRTWNSGYWDEAHSVTTDDSNNIYVAGWSYEWGVNYDFIFAKYDANGNLKWSKTRSYSTGEQATKILYDHAGHIYIAGFVNGVYSHTGGSFCLMKYTLNGDSIWEYIDNNTYDGEVKAMAIDKSGNIIIAGFENTGSTGISSDYMTMKIDSGGTLQWYKTFNNWGPNQSNKIYDLCIDKHDAIYVTGICDDSVNFYTDIITFKYDKDGNEIWKKQYNGPFNYYDGVRKILVDDKINVFVTGFCSSNSPAQSDIVLLKYDSLGTLKLSSFYDFKPAPQSFDEPVDMKLDGAGNIYIVGKSSSNNSQATMRIATLKFNSEGDTVWTRRWGLSGDKQPQQMIMDDAANIYITGHYYANNGTGYNGITMKYDSSGRLLWESSYEDSTNKEQLLFGITLDNENDIIVTGRTHSPTTFDFATIKYRNHSVGINVVKENSESLLVYGYPNPFSTKTTLNYYLPAYSESTLRIYTILGREIATIRDAEKRIGWHSYTFDTGELPSGIYFCRLECGTSYKLTKLIKRD
jgi:hypothetical protein